VSRRLPRKQDNLLAVVLAVVTVATLYFAKGILIPVALAGLLAFILTPLGGLLERARLGRTFSSLLVVFLAIGTAVGAGWTLAKQLTQVAEQLPDYQQNIFNKMEALRGTPTLALGKAANTLSEVRQRLSSAPDSKSVESTGEKARKKSAPKPPVLVQLVRTPSWPLDSLQSVVGFLLGAGLVFVFTVFMIIRREDLRNRFISLVGPGHLRAATEAMDDATARVSRYLRLQLLVNTCYGIVIGTLLHFIGLPGAFLWGVIAGILRFVPYLGAPLGGIGPVLLSVAIFPGWHATVFTLVLYVGVEVLVSQFIEPTLYGEHTGLSPVAVLLAAVFWTTLWGPLGLVMSTPLTACLLVLGRRVPRLAFLQKILGDEPALTPAAHFYQRMLAMDSQEAREVLEANLQNHSLEEVYESVLIPALELAEQDRHNSALDEFTERFLYENTREMVEEIYESRKHIDGGQNGAEAWETGAAKAAWRRTAPRLRAVSVPARDEADEIIGIMLTQMLQRAGYEADCVSRHTAEMLREVAALKPDMVCVSALPPYAISHARLLYRALHTQWPETKVIVGLWNFSGDLRLALNRMGMKDEGGILTSLSQVVQTVGLASEIAQHNEHANV